MSQLDLPLLGRLDGASTGPYFVRAEKEGHIVRPEPSNPYGWYRRKFGNGTQARAWVGV